MASLKIFLMMGLWLVAAGAWAHGEDKSGPHGGNVRMPGAFHTEVLSEGLQQFKVYLLDMEFKNPTVKNSNVELWLKQGGKTHTGQCAPKFNFFMCQFAGEVNFESGVLEIKAQRGGQVGNMMLYQLPLPSKKGKSDDHSNHNAHH